jgi:signal transduction histidine kinase/ligand-binding sensor domain-containing protein
LCWNGDQWLRFGMPRHLAAHYIDALSEASDDTVWAGSVGEGLFEFKGGRLAAINASSGLSDNMIEALLTDREGKLWVGTHGGLDRICPRKVSVHSHNEGLDYGEVQGVAEFGSGSIWVAQPDGVYQWDGQRFRRLVLAGLAPQTPAASSLLAATDGSCWLAGAFGLLHYRNPESAEKEPAVPALTNLSVSALGQNPISSEVWAGARNGGLWHFLNGAWQPQTDVPANHGITGILSDANGTLWVGTEGDGLYQLDGLAYGHCQKVRGLPSGWIRTLYLDSDHTLWIGTGGGGLCRLQNGEIATFTKREGLPDNTISQILEDDEGNLWLGGNRGIARVKKRDLADLAAQKILAIYPQIYGRADGMLSEECSGGFCPAGLKTRAGSLWFSTLKGIVVVDPRHLINSPAPTVALEQTLVDGVPESPVFERTADGLNTAHNPEPGASESLRLAPGKHTLEFRYTGLSFDAPERVRFRYRLEGLDPDWVEAGTRRAALYSFVPPGTYRLRVIACNGDGVWNEKGSGLKLTVLSYFWQTWWFLGSTTLGIAVLGVGAVRMVVKRRLQQRLRRLELDRALERERTRIAQDLHDIMGAKLCRISFMSEDARRSQAIPTDLQHQIRSISDDSREVLRSLDEVVWAINPEKDSLEHLVSYIAQYAQDYLKKTGIECELEIPAHLPTQPLTSQSRHHLFLAFHEVLTNILKHSGATCAHVSVNCRGSAFEILVSDNGRGFDPSQGESNSPGSSAGFGNGLTNMRRRLTEVGGTFQLESRPGQGTTIRFGLSLNGSVR